MMTITDTDADRLFIALQNLRKYADEAEQILKATQGKPVPDEKFLAEINAPAKLASDEPNQEPGLANLSDVKPLGEPEKEEPEPPKTFVERDSKEYLALIEFSLFKGWQESQVTNFLIQKGLSLTDRNQSHLNELRKFGQSIKANELDVSALLDWNGLSPVELDFLTEKYIF